MTTTPPGPDDYDAVIGQHVDAALSDLSPVERAELDELAAAHRAAWDQHEAEVQVVADEVQRRSSVFGAAWEQAFRAAAGTTEIQTTEIQWREPASRSAAAHPPVVGP